MVNTFFGALVVDTNILEDAGALLKSEDARVSASSSPNGQVTLPAICQVVHQACLSIFGFLKHKRSFRIVFQCGNVHLRDSTAISKIAFELSLSQYAAGVNGWYSWYELNRC